MHADSPSRRRRMLLLACWLMTLLPSAGRAAQQADTRDCEANRVAWRTALQQAWRDDVPACRAAQRMRQRDKDEPEAELLQLPMTLECAVAIYAAQWDVSDPRRFELFGPDDTRPMIALNVIGLDGRSKPSNDYQPYLGYWVTRQSPHFDANVLVCDGAQVWIEVAVRPRIVVGSWTSRAAELVAAGRMLGEPIEVLTSGPQLAQQFPSEKTVLEPWQPLIFWDPGSQPGTATPPAPPAGDSSPEPPPLPPVMIAAAMAMAVGIYALQRREAVVAPLVTPEAEARPTPAVDFRVVLKRD